MQDKLKEIFAAPKGQLQVVADVGGVKFYTSALLRRNFLKAILKSSRSKPIASTIAKLMQNGEFYPCYLTKKITTFLSRKRPEEFKYYAGLSWGKYIFIFVDNDTNIFGFTSNDKLSIVTIHELIHKFSQKHPNQFFQIFKGDLINFYKAYWTKLFNVKESDIDNKQIENIVSFMYFQLEHGVESNKKLIQYHGLLKETFKSKSTLEEKPFEKLINDYIVLIKIIFKGKSSGSGSLIEKAVYSMKNITVPFYTTYNMVFGIKVKTLKVLCYQELFYPSEVISVPAVIKRPNAKVYNAIKKL